MAFYDDVKKKTSRQRRADAFARSEAAQGPRRAPR